MNLWIKNGHVLDPANHLDEVCDVYVKEGKVACVGSLSSDKIPDECTVIDAEGKYVMPGLVDLHVHLREPGFEYKGNNLFRYARDGKGRFYSGLSDAKYKACDRFSGND